MKIKFNTDLIKKKMFAMGINTIKLGEVMGISSQNLYCILNGKTKNPTLSIVIKIMRFFKIENIEDLIVEYE